MKSRRFMDLYARLSEALYAVDMPIKYLDELLELAVQNHADTGRISGSQSQELETIVQH